MKVDYSFILRGLTPGQAGNGSGTSILSLAENSIQESFMWLHEADRQLQAYI